MMSRRRKPTRLFRPRFEILESRRCLAVDVIFLADEAALRNSLADGGPSEYALPHPTDGLEFSRVGLGAGAESMSSLLAEVVEADLDHDEAGPELSAHESLSAAELSAARRPPVSLQVEVELIGMLLQAEELSHPSGPESSSIVIVARPLATVELTVVAWDAGDSNAMRGHRDARLRAAEHWAALSPSEAGRKEASTFGRGFPVNDSEQQIVSPSPGDSDSRSDPLESLPVSQDIAGAGCVAREQQLASGQPQQPGPDQLAMLEAELADFVSERAAATAATDVAAAGGEDVWSAWTDAVASATSLLGLCPLSTYEFPDGETLPVLGGAVLAVTFGQPLTRLTSPWVPAYPHPTPESALEGGEWLEDLSGLLTSRTTSTIIVGATLTSAVAIIAWPQDRRHKPPPASQTTFDPAQETRPAPHDDAV